MPNAKTAFSRSNTVFCSPADFTVSLQERGQRKGLIFIRSGYIFLSQGTPETNDLPLTSCERSDSKVNLIHRTLSPSFLSPLQVLNPLYHTCFTSTMKSPRALHVCHKSFIELFQFSPMSDSNRLETYHTLFSLVVEDPRITPKKIAKRLNYSGQGKAPSTLLYHLQNMYEQKISFPPKLKLKPYEDWIPIAYICRKQDMKNTYSAFQYLKRDDDILYVMMLSGADFFIVSSNPNLNMEQYGLQIEKKSIFYHSIYTIPKGWKDTPDDVFCHVLNSNFEKGKIMRKLHGALDWTKLEWRIFFSMYENVRKKISVVTRQTDVTYKTVKRHFEDFVLPKCSIAHYFFPEGYDNYKYMYLRIKSDFEKSLIASFKYWPCTTYFYPLEDELDAVLFFESHEKILELLEKLKEIDVISDYLLYIPIVHGND